MMKGAWLTVAALCALCAGAARPGASEGRVRSPERPSGLVKKWSAVKSGLVSAPPQADDNQILEQSETQARETVTQRGSSAAASTLGAREKVSKRVPVSTSALVQGAVLGSRGNRASEDSLQRQRERKQKLREKLYSRNRVSRGRSTTQEPIKISREGDENQTSEDEKNSFVSNDKYTVAQVLTTEIAPVSMQRRIKEERVFRFKNITDSGMKNSEGTKTIVSSVHTSYKITESFPSNSTIVKNPSIVEKNEPKRKTFSRRVLGPVKKYRSNAIFQRRRNTLKPKEKDKMKLNTSGNDEDAVADRKIGEKLLARKVSAVKPDGKLSGSKKAKGSVTQENNKEKHGKNPASRSDRKFRTIIPLSSRLRNVGKISPRTTSAGTESTTTVLPTTRGDIVPDATPEVLTTTAPKTRRRFTPRSRLSVPPSFKKKPRLVEDSSSSRGRDPDLKLEKTVQNHNDQLEDPSTITPKKTNLFKKYFRTRQKKDRLPEPKTTRDDSDKPQKKLLMRVTPISTDTRRHVPTLTNPRSKSDTKSDKKQLKEKLITTTTEENVGEIKIVVKDPPEARALEKSPARGSTTSVPETRTVQDARSSSRRRRERVSKAPIIDLVTESRASPPNSEKSVRKFKRRGSRNPEHTTIKNAVKDVIDTEIFSRGNIAQQLAPISSLITLTTVSNSVTAPEISTSIPDLPTMAPVTTTLAPTTDRIRAYTAGRRISVFGLRDAKYDVDRIVASPVPSVNATQAERGKHETSEQSNLQTAANSQIERLLRRDGVTRNLLAPKNQFSVDKAVLDRGRRNSKFVDSAAVLVQTLTSSITVADTAPAQSTAIDQPGTNLLVLPSEQIPVIAAQNQKPANALSGDHTPSPDKNNVDGFERGKGVIKNKGGKESREGAWAQDSSRGYYKKSGTAPEERAHGEKEKDFKGFHESFVVEKSGRSREFFDDVDHINYYHRFDNAEKLKEKLDAGRRKGLQFKNSKLGDKYGQRGRYEKGHDLQDEKGKKKFYGHNDKYHHFKKYGSKDFKESDHKNKDDRRQKLNGIYQGAHTVLQPWEQALERLTGSLGNYEFDGHRYNYREDDEYDDAEHGDTAAVSHFPQDFESLQRALGPQLGYKRSDSSKKPPSKIKELEKPQTKQKSDKEAEQKENSIIKSLHKNGDKKTIQASAAPNVSENKIELPKNSPASLKLKSAESLNQREVNQHGKRKEKMPQKAQPEGTLPETQKLLLGVHTFPNAVSLGLQPTQSPQQPAQAPQQPAQVPQQPAQVSQQPAQVPQQPAQVPPQPAQVPPQPAQVFLQPKDDPSNSKAELSDVISSVEHLAAVIGVKEALLQPKDVEFGRRITPLKRKHFSSPLNSLSGDSQELAKASQQVELQKKLPQPVKINMSGPEEHKMASESHTQEVKVISHSERQEPAAEPRKLGDGLEAKAGAHSSAKANSTAEASSSTGANLNAKTNFSAEANSRTGEKSSAVEKYDTSEKSNAEVNFGSAVNWSDGTSPSSISKSSKTEGLADVASTTIVPGVFLNKSSVPERLPEIRTDHALKDQRTTIIPSKEKDNTVNHGAKSTETNSPAADVASVPAAAALTNLRTIKDQQNKIRQQERLIELQKQLLQQQGLQLQHQKASEQQRLLLNQQSAMQVRDDNAGSLQRPLDFEMKQSSETKSLLKNVNEKNSQLKNVEALENKKKLSKVSKAERNSKLLNSTEDSEENRDSSSHETQPMEANGSSGGVAHGAHGTKEIMSPPVAKSDGVQIAREDNKEGQSLVSNVEDRQAGKRSKANAEENLRNKSEQKTLTNSKKGAIQKSANDEENKESNSSMKGGEKASRDAQVNELDTHPLDSVYSDGPSRSEAPYVKVEPYAQEDKELVLAIGKDIPVYRRRQDDRQDNRQDNRQGSTEPQPRSRRPKKARFQSMKTEQGDPAFQASNLPSNFKDLVPADIDFESFGDFKHDENSE